MSAKSIIISLSTMAPLIEGTYVEFSDCPSLYDRVRSLGERVDAETKIIIPVSSSSSRPSRAERVIVNGRTRMISTLDQIDIAVAAARPYWSRSKGENLRQCLNDSISEIDGVLGHFRKLLNNRQTYLRRNRIVDLTKSGDNGQEELVESPPSPAANDIDNADSMDTQPPFVESPPPPAANGIDALLPESIEVHITERSENEEKERQHVEDGAKEERAHMQEKGNVDNDGEGEAEEEWAQMHKSVFEDKSAYDIDVMMRETVSNELTRMNLTVPDLAGDAARKLTGYIRRRWQLALELSRLSEMPMSDYNKCHLTIVELRCKAKKLGLIAGKLNKKELLKRFVEHELGGEKSDYDETMEPEINQMPFQELPDYAEAMGLGTRLSTTFDTTQKPTIVLICHRYSGNPSDSVLKNSRTMQQRVKSLLQSGEILDGLASVPFHHVYRKMISLTRTLPLVGRARSDPSMEETPSSQLIKPLLTAAPGSRVVLVTMGFEGLSCNQDGLKEFFEFWQEKKGLELQILIAENAIQWRTKKKPWNPANWIGPHCGRYWALLSFKDLINSINGINDCNLAAEYLEQLRASERYRKRVDMGYIGPGRNALTG